MAIRFFSQEWAAAWRQEINASAGFRDRGADWRGSLVLAMKRDGPHDGEETVFVDLRDGECTTSRRGTAADRRNASFVIQADERTWRSLFAGRSDLLLAIALGRFSLERGSLDQLRPHMAAARELLRAAGQVTSE
jgi:putative sterol carrier protein